MRWGGVGQVEPYYMSIICDKRVLNQSTITGSSENQETVGVSVETATRHRSDIVSLRGPVPQPWRKHPHHSLACASHMDDTLGMQWKKWLSNEDKCVGCECDHMQLSRAK
jgi:hypothetical protein